MASDSKASPAGSRGGRGVVLLSSSIRSGTTAATSGSSGVGGGGSVGGSGTTRPGRELIPSTAPGAGGRGTNTQTSPAPRVPPRHEGVTHHPHHHRDAASGSGSSGSHPAPYHQHGHRHHRHSGSSSGSGKSVSDDEGDDHDVGLRVLASGGDGGGRLTGRTGLSGAGSTSTGGVTLPPARYATHTTTPSTTPATTSRAGLGHGHAFVPAPPTSFPMRGVSTASSTGMYEDDEDMYQPEEPSLTVGGHRNRATTGGGVLSLGHAASLEDSTASALSFSGGDGLGDSAHWSLPHQAGSAVVQAYQAAMREQAAAAVAVAMRHVEKLGGGVGLISSTAEHEREASTAAVNRHSALNLDFNVFPGGRPAVPVVKDVKPLVLGGDGEAGEASSGSIGIIRPAGDSGTSAPITASGSVTRPSLNIGVSNATPSSSDAGTIRRLVSGGGESGSASTSASAPRPALRIATHHDGAAPHTGRTPSSASGGVQGGAGRERLAQMASNKRPSSGSGGGIIRRLNGSEVGEVVTASTHDTGGGLSDRRSVDRGALALNLGEDGIPVIAARGGSGMASAPSGSGGISVRGLAVRPGSGIRSAWYDDTPVAGEGEGGDTQDELAHLILEGEVGEEGDNTGELDADEVDDDPWRVSDGPGGTIRIGNMLAIGDSGLKVAPVSIPRSGNIKSELVMLDVLGRGGSAMVNRALHLPTMQLVAVKHIKTDAKIRQQEMARELKLLYANMAPLENRVPHAAFGAGGPSGGAGDMLGSTLGPGGAKPWLAAPFTGSDSTTVSATTTPAGGDGTWPKPPLAPGVRHTQPPVYLLPAPPNGAGGALIRAATATTSSTGSGEDDPRPPSAFPPRPPVGAVLSALPSTTHLVPSPDATSQPSLDGKAGLSLTSGGSSLLGTAITSGPDSSLRSAPGLGGAGGEGGHHSRLADSFDATLTSIEDSVGGDSGVMTARGGAGVGGGAGGNALGNTLGSTHLFGATLTSRAETGPMEGGSNPYMVKFYDAYVNKGAQTVSIVMEFMSGGTLQDLVAAGGCRNESVLARMAAHVLRGLHFLHSQHQLHRDIKPGNILMSLGGDVYKVSDFGITRQMDSTLDFAKTWVGTVAYMSPERITSDEYTFPADIWSFGLSMLAVAAGRYPYGKTDVWHVMEGAKSDKPPFHVLDTPPNMTSPTASAFPSTATPVSAGSGATPTSSGGAGGSGPSPAPLPPMSPDFLDFIAMAMKRDPKDRWTAEQLLHHPFLRAHVLEEEKARSTRSTVGGGHLRARMPSTTGEPIIVDEAAGRGGLRPRRGSGGKADDKEGDEFEEVVDGMVEGGGVDDVNMFTVPIGVPLSHAREVPAKLRGAFAELPQEAQNREVKLVRDIATTTFTRAWAPFVKFYRRYHNKRRRKWYFALDETSFNPQLADRVATTLGTTTQFPPGGGPSTLLRTLSIGGGMPLPIPGGTLRLASLGRELSGYDGGGTRIASPHHTPASSTLTSDMLAAAAATAAKLGSSMGGTLGAHNQHHASNNGVVTFRELRLEGRDLAMMATQLGLPLLVVLDSFNDVLRTKCDAIALEAKAGGSVTAPAAAAGGGGPPAAAGAIAGKEGGTMVPSTGGSTTSTAPVTRATASGTAIAAASTQRRHHLDTEAKAGWNALVTMGVGAPHAPVSNDTASGAGIAATGGGMAPVGPMTSGRRPLSVRSPGSTVSGVLLGASSTHSSTPPSNQAVSSAVGGKEADVDGDGVIDDDDEDAGVITLKPTTLSGAGQPLAHPRPSGGGVYHQYGLLPTGGGMGGGSEDDGVVRHAVSTFMHGPDEAGGGSSMVMGMGRNVTHLPALVRPPSATQAGGGDGVASTALGVRPASASSVGLCQPGPGSTSRPVSSSSTRLAPLPRTPSTTTTPTHLTSPPSNHGSRLSTPTQGRRLPPMEHASPGIALGGHEDGDDGELRPRRLSALSGAPTPTSTARTESVTINLGDATTHTVHIPDLPSSRTGLGSLAMVGGGGAPTHPSIMPGSGFNSPEPSPTTAGGMLPRRPVLTSPGTSSASMVGSGSVSSTTAPTTRPSPPGSTGTSPAGYPIAGSSAPSGGLGARDMSKPAGPTMLPRSGR